MKASQKGAAIELVAVCILLFHQFVVHRAMRTLAKTPVGPRTISHDVFGCIDIIAKKERETKWIQVTSLPSIAQKKRDLASVPWHPVHDSVEIWQWIGSKHSAKDADGELLPDQYFQIYRRDQDFRYIESNRIFAWPDVL